MSLTWTSRSSNFAVGFEDGKILIGGPCDQNSDQFRLLSTIHACQSTIENVDFNHDGLLS